MLACSCFAGFRPRGGGLGGEGGWFGSGIFQSSIGIALQMVSFSSFSVRGNGGEGVGTTSCIGVEVQEGILGIVHMLSDHSSTSIFPSFHGGTVVTFSLVFGIGLNVKLSMSTGCGAAGWDL